MDLKICVNWLISLDVVSTSRPLRDLKLFFIFFLMISWRSSTEQVYTRESSLVVQSFILMLILRPRTKSQLAKSTLYLKNFYGACCRQSRGDCGGENSQIKCTFLCHERLVSNCIHSAGGAAAQF